MEIIDGHKLFYAKSRKEWRTWLKKNQSKEKSVWLVLYKKSSSVTSVTYDEAVEEALCFGWIDSIKKKRDEESSIQYFSKRKPKSNWSKLNKQRVARLIEQGLMTPTGLEMIELAKSTGTWTALDSIEDLTIPDDLHKLFNKNKKAYANFMLFSSSSKKIILLWILSAKKTETRQQRIEQTVDLAGKNIKANHPAPPIEAEILSRPK
ncbi:MAG: YdeI/OmpD-associated family protein [Leptospira sp.]|nr:YdeI/OmpD-associated family protein [Leptospira sp.]